MAEAPSTPARQSSTPSAAWNVPVGPLLGHVPTVVLRDYTIRAAHG